MINRSELIDHMWYAFDDAGEEMEPVLDTVLAVVDAEFDISVEDKGTVRARSLQEIRGAIRILMASKDTA